MTCLAAPAANVKLRATQCSFRDAASAANIDVLTLTLILTLTQDIRY